MLKTKWRHLPALKDSYFDGVRLLNLPNYIDNQFSGTGLVLPLISKVLCAVGVFIFREYDETSALRGTWTACSVCTKNIAGHKVHSSVSLANCTKPDLDQYRAGRPSVCLSAPLLTGPRQLLSNQPSILHNQILHRGPKICLGDISGRGSDLFRL